MRFTLWAALFGFVGVALGAFGAHALKKHVDAHDLEIWETAVKYQLFHALALIGVDSALWIARGAGHDSVKGALGVAGICFIVGISIFSGSLYALVGTGVRKLGMVTPIGGVGLLAGWAALGWAAWKMRT
ncbi:MAG: DUF423 domain-containing protein [Myxococcales bacterium]|nr:DUF423 domain-containing protein [Myxococcales bacterium]